MFVCEPCFLNQFGHLGRANLQTSFPPNPMLWNALQRISVSKINTMQNIPPLKQAIILVFFGIGDH